ncbi:hypothetical protein LTR67_006986 [Exophiala xenobiotica]
MAATEEPSRLEREDSPPSANLSAVGENSTMESDTDSEDEPTSFATSEIVNVLVGKKRSVFKLHRHVLMEKSPFFQKCLTSGMVEQQTNEVNLPEDSSRAFEYVVRWVYSTSIIGAEAGRERYDIITRMRAWMLADKYCMPDLQNALINELGLYWSTNWMDPELLSWVADHADCESPLYRLTLDEMAYDLQLHSKLYPDNNGYQSPEIDEDHSEAFKRVLARPILANRLLWKTIRPFHEDDSPADSPQNYHVPDKLLIGGATSTNATKLKRWADDNTKDPRVVFKVARQF